MNTPRMLNSLGRNSNVRGIALVLVLCSLVILSGLVIAYFTAVSTESASSRSFAAENDSRTLAEEALHVVVSQIQDATTKGTGYAWISQPGLLRTFDTKGTQSMAYKLYSSDALQVTGSFDPQTDTPPSNWYTTPALFTDLNAPVYVTDPNGSISLNSGTYSAVYPIVDPTAAYDANSNPNGVHGFAINQTSTPVAPTVTGSTPSNPAPMPTRWLYLLRDGSLVSGSLAKDGKSVKVALATGTNPIVGRVAFWTDDDTCKVNLNTAAGDLWTSGTMPGSFMDMPHASTNFEKSLGNNQPVSKEFQRYPGHPGTTYLSAVFPFLTQKDIADVAPRVGYGGSLGGLVSSTTAIISDTDRLYASSDELLYSPTYSAAVRLPTQAKTGNPALSGSILAKAGFFLTAHSRAPEVNLFNYPRVSIWPEASDPSKQTTFDKTIAFCSTVGGKPFYFVRNDPYSSTNDYAFQRNQEIYNYLQSVTGGGANTENAAIPTEIPGFGGSFYAKYGNDRDQILTEIFDYIRCTNLCDASQSGTANRYTVGPSKPTQINYCPPGTGAVVPIEINTKAGVTRGFGRMPTVHSPTLLIYPKQYVPDIPANPQNWGTTKSVRGLFLIEPFTPAQGVMRVLPNLVFEVKGLDGLTLDGVNMGFPISGTTSYLATSPYHDYGYGSLEGAANLLWISGTAKKLGSTSIDTDYQLFSGVVPLASGSGKRVNPEYSPYTNTGNFGSYMTLASTKPITINVYSRTTSGVISKQPIQTLTFQFPTSTNLPTPRPATGNGGNLGASAPKSYSPLENMSVRGHSTSELRTDQYPSVSGSGTQTMSENDPVRSVEPTTGDARLIAAMKNVPAAAFTKDRDYDLKSLFCSDMRGGNGLCYAGSWGKLVNAATYVYVNPTTYYPAVPSFTSSATSSSQLGAYLLDSAGGQSPGDWDTGMGSVPDGPYINKPDEGDAGSSAYFAYDGVPVQASLFSPNRQVPSPVIFGSLSTGVKASEAAFTAGTPAMARPWQTLLFCPNPAAGNLHPGKVSPPDHLLLDLFMMPVVEPYPISEPFSTAGKINLNCQIVPFGYITRNTGLQAVLKSTRVTAIPTSSGTTYKSGAGNANYRFEIDPDATLQGFTDRFTANKPFVSASEICDMFLVPVIPNGSQLTYTGMASWWNNYALTGDNLREQPYAHLYSRLTTKSNTYTIHVRAQKLLKRAISAADTWTEGADQVLSEYRGSYTVERFLDPNITTYDETKPLTDYKIRVIDSKQFAP